MLEDGIIKTAPPWDRLGPGPLGTRRYKRGRCEDGYTLFCPGQGNLVCLIDMAGMLVHFWVVHRSHLVELLPDGTLLADEWGETSGLSELGSEGQVLWRWSGDYHHDFQRLDGGNRFVLLTHRVRSPMDGFFLSEERPSEVLSDVVIEVDRDGQVLWEFSFADHAVQLAELAGLGPPVRYGVRDRTGALVMLNQRDWTHTNTIEVLPDTKVGWMDRRFRGGNLLFSCRSLDTIGVIDRDSGDIVWAWGPGILDGQHQPTMLANGNILVFDNGTYRGYSVVREIAMPEAVEVWSYEDRENFFSPYRSGAQRLGGGNTLICEADAGRLFEVTPEGEVVWDYYSPFWGTNHGNEGRHVYRATRYSEAEVAPLLAGRAPVSGAVGMDGRWPRRPSAFVDVLRYYEEGFLAESW